ncbi:MAG: hypothetical protein M3387_07955 [Actinomycetota bacterium]|nr:hypothetical protein [Actinomycetota bacterium]
MTDVAEDERRWGEAHSMFREVRQETLRLEATDGDPFCKALVLIAESASKVIYNASGHAAPFDANSGTVLVLRAAELAVTLDRDAATDLLWHAVARSPTPAQE